MGTVVLLNGSALRVGAWLRLWAAMIALVLAMQAVRAQEVYVPPELEPWEQWALHGEEFRRCPLRLQAGGMDGRSFSCAWPGVLRIALTTDSGQFSQTWRTYADGWVELPGELTYWPERVRVDGQTVSVAARHGIPHVYLPAGEHTLEGGLVWMRRPESLRVPLATVLVDLSIEGRDVSPAEIRGDRLWLGAVRAVTVPRGLQVHVYRLIQDDIPLRLLTRLQLKVSGDAREELLARALPEGFTPMAVHGSLPARFESDGRLRVQVRSGEHELTLFARATQPMTSLRLPQRGEGEWSEEEVWSYEAQDRLRITAVEGPTLLDPLQAGVPHEWRDFPAYRMLPQTVFAIGERTRGLSAADANRLSLRRELWLDFDRDGLLAFDTLSGEMRRDWRLDMHGPYRLLSARSANEPLLVTQGDAGTGVELRTPQVHLTTVSRVAHAVFVPATGWSTRFDSAYATLHTSPGHRLLAAFGVDAAPSAWMERWRLLDLFAVMLIVVAAYRLLGVAGAAVAAGAAVLTHHEPFAPSWLWVNALLAIALARFVPEGRARLWTNAYRIIAIAVLGLALIPFALTQYRAAVHPQLDSGAERITMRRSEGETVFALTQMTVQDAPAVALEIPAPELARQADRAVTLSAPAVAAPESPKRLDRYAPDALLQTGPGVPTWHYISHPLRWDGQVSSERVMRLVIVPPWLLAAWRIAGVVLSAVFLAMLIRFARGESFRWPRLRLGSAAPMVVVACFAVVLGTHSAHAAGADANVLDELKARLTAPPRCAPDCVTIASAAILIEQNRLEVRLEVHAQARAAVGVPHAGPHWAVERVAVDERTLDILARDDDARVLLPVEPGVHRVRMSGPIVHADELTLEFATRPHRVSVHSAGWDVNGHSEGRLLNSALQLTRRASDRSGTPTMTPQRFAPFVRIHRTLSLGLDWTVHTRVQRIAPDEGVFTMRLPLLPGESVLTPGLEVRDGEVLVSFGATQSTASWDGTLVRLDRLELNAQVEQPWVERWWVQASPMWHVDFSGAPALMPEDLNSEAWIHEFLPRPGETLTVTVARPGASAGATVAIDDVQVEVVFGQRSQTTMLNFGYRATQGGRHDIHLPEDARVQFVQIDGRSVPLRPTEGVLPLTFAPGSHRVEVQLQRDLATSIVAGAPSLNLGSESSNIRTTLQPSADRWVLFAWGSGVGPAFVYWSELALFIIVASLLGRSGTTPLKRRDWLFLGLGLSTFSWWILLVFGAWMFLLQRRERWRVDSRARFNVLQVAIALGSLGVLVLLVSAIPFGLLGQPNMGVRSVDSHGLLTWFLDHSGPQLPQPQLVCVSIWFYRLAMLAWALWLSFALLRWLPWAWRQYSVHGVWRKKAGSEPALA